jgi:hypothetical protein
MKLVVLTDQLKSAVDSGEIEGEWTTEQLLNFLSANGVNVDEPDIFDMVKKPPLNKAISSINNDVVTFKGQEQPDLPEPDQNQSANVVKQMAQNALKK